MIRAAYRAEFKASAHPLPPIAHICAMAVPSIHVTMHIMLLARIAMRVLEVLFFIGMLGSAVVIVISFAEDWKELFQKD
jgi:hypothetical protein